MISTNDFKDEQGHVDWNAYKEAQKDAGEICYKCGKYIMRLFRDPVGRERCVDCKDLHSEQAITHDHFVRCPFCRHEMSVDELSVWEEGEHNVWCDLCDEQFEVSTMVSYTFQSPPLGSKNNEEE